MNGLFATSLSIAALSPLGQTLVLLAVAGTGAFGLYAVTSAILRIRARDLRHLGNAAIDPEGFVMKLKPVFERLAYVASRLPLQGYQAWMRRTLLKANLLQDCSPELLQTIKLFVLICALILLPGLFYIWGFGTPWFSIFIVSMALYFLPDMVVIGRANERQNAMRKSLPFVIDLIAVSAEAGLAFQQAIRNVVSNAQRGGGEEMELLQEFEYLLGNLRMGRPMADALGEAARRVQLEEFNTFVNSILQAERLGTPVSETLKRQGAELREKLASRMEAKANQAPVKILFPLMIFIFPVTGWVIIGPVLLRVFMGDF